MNLFVHFLIYGRFDVLNFSNRTRPRLEQFWELQNIKATINLEMHLRSCDFLYLQLHSMKQLREYSV